MAPKYDHKVTGWNNGKGVVQSEYTDTNGNVNYQSDYGSGHHTLHPSGHLSHLSDEENEELNDNGYNNT